MQYDFDEQDDFRPGCGFVALAAAVIRGALADATSGHPARKAAAREFFAGDWFAMLATAAGLDLDAARERLRARGMM